ncbi:MAG: Gp37-like protein [Faecalibacterium prausnitzii]
MFEVWRPTADPNNRFSTKWGSLREAAWAFGDGSYANVALVLGRARQRPGHGLGGRHRGHRAERREMIVDARDIQPEDGETVKSDSYLKKLADRGASKLLEQLRNRQHRDDCWTPTASSRATSATAFCPTSATRPPSGWPTSSFRARPTAPPAPRGWVRPSGTRSRRR